MQRSVGRAFVLALAICLIGGIAISQEQAREVQDPIAQQAMLALADLLVESKGYEDNALKVEVKTRMADMLWRHERERAHALILAAFDEAAALKDKPSVQLELLSELIRVATRHDPSLATRLIARRNEKVEENAASVQRGAFDRITERSALYLESAITLLNENKQVEATELARRSISEGRSGRFFWFLNQLKRRDEAAAEKLFLDALALMSNAPADPNDVVLFGMWLFFPNSQSVSSTGSGADNIQLFATGMDFSAAPAPSLTLLKPYLQVAAEVLALVPTPPGAVKAIELKRYALNKLLPVYELYMPERVARIQEQLGSLGQAASWAPTPQEARGVKTNAAIDEGLSASDEIALIDKLPDEQQRDQRFFDVSARLIDRGNFEKARALAARISYAALREPLLEMIAYREAKKDVERGELEEAERIATSQLTQERRALIYFELSKAWFSRGDLVRAGQQVNAAILEAARTDDRAARARVYTFLASGLAKHDELRAFEMIETAIKDINAVEKFNPTGEALMFEFSMPGGGSHSYGFGQAGSLTTVLPVLARSDFYRAINAARSLTQARPRALSVIETCRAVLGVEKKSGDKKAEDKKAKPGPKTPGKNQSRKPEKN